MYVKSARYLSTNMVEFMNIKEGTLSLNNHFIIGKFAKRARYLLPNMRMFLEYNINCFFPKTT